jgi:prepilin signal peptidase PulO-like enzyme (type II secretory pathway)
MNAALAATSAAGATVMYWMIADDAAVRRRMTIGSLPLLLPIAAAVTTCVASIAGISAPAVAATAGVAVAGLVDARTGSIFDPLTISMLLASLALAAVSGSVIDGCCGAAAVGAALLTLHAISHGRGIGLGDVKLGAALGMALGVAGALTAIGLAFVFGGAYGVWLLATRRAQRDASIRFGPFIAAGTFATLLVPLGYHA